MRRLLILLSLLVAGCGGSGNSTPITTPDMMVTYGSWIADPALGGLDADGSSRNLSIFSYAQDAGPFSDVVVSRDRKSVLFVTTRAGFYRPWICRTSGSGKGFDILYEVRGSYPSHPINLAISPDSKRI